MEPLSRPRKILATKISYISQIMIYFGYIHECAELYRQLCRESREEWNSKSRILIDQERSYKAAINFLECLEEYPTFLFYDVKLTIRNETYDYANRFTKLYLDKGFDMEALKIKFINDLTHEMYSEFYKSLYFSQTYEAINIKYCEKEEKIKCLSLVVNPYDKDIDFHKTFDKIEFQSMQIYQNYLPKVCEFIENKNEEGVFYDSLKCCKKIEFRDNQIQDGL